MIVIQSQVVPSGINQIESKNWKAKVTEGILILEQTPNLLILKDSSLLSYRSRLLVELGKGIVQTLIFFSHTKSLKEWVWYSSNVATAFTALELAKRHILPKNCLVSFRLKAKSNKHKGIDKLPVSKLEPK